MSAPTLNRVRHPLRYRRGVVERAEPLTRRVRRIVVAGEELDGFVSPGFDDHVKLFFPDETGALPAPIVGPDRLTFPDGVVPPPGRDFTPRRFDAARRTLTFDMGVHGDGPAARWAARAEAGVPVGIAGPRGSTLVDDGFAWNLLVGDETALPAIARRLEEAPAALQLIVVVDVHDRHERVTLDSQAHVDLHWRHHDSASVIDVLASIELPPGDGFAWVAGERDLARQVRHHLIEARRIEPDRVKASAYWRRGNVGRHEVLG